MEKIKVFECFAGVGSQRMALKNLGIPHEVVAISEIDKYALESYKAIHGDCPNVGDISKLSVEDIPDHDLFTYSFPCQDISVAGRHGGFVEGSGTRSSLLWECKKVIENKKPKYLLLENVKNLVSKQYKEHFDIWLKYLEEQGYRNYWEVLNAKDYGVAQNRERVFVVSIRNDVECDFVFEEKMELTKTLSDYLDFEVDEKFYVDNKKVEQFIENVKGSCDFEKSVLGTCHVRNDLSFATRDRIFNIEKESPTLTATMYKDPPKILVEKKVKQIGNIVTTGNWKNPQRGRIYGVDGISPALNTVGGGGLEPKIVTNIKTVDADNYRIRKLTPIECWRLMGFNEEDFYKVKEVCSNSQIYKQCGNSIVVPVLESIFRKMFQ